MTADTASHSRISPSKQRTRGAAMLVISSLLVVGAGLAAWKYLSIKKAMAMPPMAEPPTAVKVVEVATAPYRPTAELVGTVIATRTVAVSNEVAGTVTQVGFESGQIVEAGQVLLTLDSRTDEADISMAQAGVRVAESNTKVFEAKRTLWEANLSRFTQALAAKAATAADVDDAKANYDQANAELERVRAEIDQAKSHVEQLRVTLAKKTIKAPFRARAGLRTVHPGQYLQEGAQVVSLQSVEEKIFLDFAVPQDQLFRVKIGETVVANAPMLGKEPVNIKVVATDATVNPSTRNMRVRGEVMNANEALRPGMSVEVRVPLGDEMQVLVVPATAIRRASFGDHVFVLGQDPKDRTQTRANVRMVKIGFAMGENVVVIEGLSAGERIAADGSFKLREGALVMEGPPQAPGK